ncbi:MAG: hypothetical protein LBI04_01085 [Treponema sp.]|jgi:hypothetical protein|nr:hypothetical protein [Treponema sp.]
MKIFQYILLAVIISASIYAQGAGKNFTITPLLNYEYLSFQEQKIHSPGEGNIVYKG